jgi:hypothetical protein
VGSIPTLGSIKYTRSTHAGWEGMDAWPVSAVGGDQVICVTPQSSGFGANYTTYRVYATQEYSMW